jgi:hypothetical protein
VQTWTDEGGTERGIRQVRSALANAGDRAECCSRTYEMLSDRTAIATAAKAFGLAENRVGFAMNAGYRQKSETTNESVELSFEKGWPKIRTAFRPVPPI